jgi:hypothetical protein
MINELFNNIICGIVGASFTYIFFSNKNTHIVRIDNDMLPEFSQLYFELDLEPNDIRDAKLIDL